MEQTATDISPFKKGLLWSGLLAVLLVVSIAGINELSSDKDQAYAGQMREPLTREWKVGDFVLVDRSGRQFSSRDYLGKIWVVNFIFTSCYGQCPLMLGQMKKLQDVYHAVPDLRLVSITCDPQVDTKERLSDFAKKHGADSERWLFLTGEEEAVQRVARDCLKLAYGPANARQIKEGQESILHSDRFLLVDREGWIVGFYTGTEATEVERLIKEIKILDQR